MLCCHTCSLRTCRRVVIGQFSERTHVVRRITTHREKDTRLTFDVVAQSKHQVQGMIQGPTRFFASSTAKSSVGSIMGDIQKTEERVRRVYNQMYASNKTNCVCLTPHTFYALVRFRFGAGISWLRPANFSLVQGELACMSTKTVPHTHNLNKKVYTVDANNLSKNANLTKKNKYSHRKQKVV